MAKLFKKINFDSKSIKVNAIFNSIYQILVLLAPLITTPYISRVLGVDAIGSYQYCYSIMNYFTLVAMFGFSDYGIKKIAELRDDKAKRSNAFWEIMFSKGLISLICLIVYFIITLILFSGTEMMIFLVMSLFVISVLLDPTFYFQGRENFISICIRNIIVRLFTILMIFIVVHSPDDVVLYALVLAGSNFLSAIIMFFSFKGSINKPDFKEMHVLEQFKKSFPFFIPALSISLFTSLNQTLLGAILKNDTVSGYYAQAIRFSNLIGSFVGSLSTIMLSRISYLHAHNDEEQVKHKVKVAFHAAWAIGLPCVFGICAISHVLIPVFLGPGYEPVIYLIYIIAPIGIISPINTLYGNVYYKAYNKIWYQTGILLTAAIVSISLNFLLIPKFGATGCAIASLAAELVQVPIYMFFSRKTFDHKELFKTIVKPLDASLIMLIAIYVLDSVIGNSISNTLAVVIYILFGIIVYGIFILLFKDDFILPLVQKVFVKVKTKLFKK